MTKFDVSCGNGDDTIILDLNTSHIFSFEKDYKRLEELYGLNNYYSSRSGLSGAGTIDLNITNKALIEVGSYRTDTVGIHQYYRPLKGNIALYVPRKKYEGYDSDYPFVLTDGRKVEMFADQSKILERVRDWHITKGKEKKLTYYNPINLDLETFNYEASKDFYRKYVSPVRFLDLRSLRDQTTETLDLHLWGANDPLFRALKIYHHKPSGRYISINKSGLIIHIYNDPFTDEKLPFGWERYKNITFKRFVKEINLHDQPEDYIYSICNIPRPPSMKHTRLTDRVHYEEKIATIDLFLKYGSIENLEAYMSNKVLFKAKEDYKTCPKDYDNEQIVKFIMNNPEKTISVQDARNTGNCDPGINSFRQEYRLPVNVNYVSFSDLLQNPKLDSMIRVWDFRKIIINKMEECNDDAKQSVEKAS